MCVSHCTMIEVTLAPSWCLCDSDSFHPSPSHGTKSAKYHRQSKREKYAQRPTFDAMSSCRVVLLYVLWYATLVAHTSNIPIPGAV